MLRTVSRKIALGGLAAAGVLAVGIAVPTVAFADDSPTAPAPSPSSTSAAPAPDSRRRRPAGWLPDLSAASAEALPMDWASPRTR